MIALLVVPGIISKLIRETQVEKMKMVLLFLDLLHYSTTSCIYRPIRVWGPFPRVGT